MLFIHDINKVILVSHSALSLSERKVPLVWERIFAVTEKCLWNRKLNLILLWIKNSPNPKEFLKQTAIKNENSKSEGKSCWVWCENLESVGDWHDVLHNAQSCGL